EDGPKNEGTGDDPDRGGRRADARPRLGVPGHRRAARRARARAGGLGPLYGPPPGGAGPLPRRLRAGSAWLRPERGAGPRAGHGRPGRRAGRLDAGGRPEKGRAHRELHGLPGHRLAGPAPSRARREGGFAGPDDGPARAKHAPADRAFPNRHAPRAPFPDRHRGSRPLPGGRWPVLADLPPRHRGPHRGEAPEGARAGARLARLARPDLARGLGRRGRASPARRPARRPARGGPRRELLRAGGVRPRGPVLPRRRV
ncbi:MAG: hypothetical protein AVDCRST_MAG02-2462, partial [uncultured Rubrobacteraceae bacterium]